MNVCTYLTQTHRHTHTHTHTHTSTYRHTDIQTYEGIHECSLTFQNGVVNTNNPQDFQPEARFVRLAWIPLDGSIHAAPEYSYHQMILMWFRGTNPTAPLFVVHKHHPSSFSGLLSTDTSTVSTLMVNSSSPFASYE